MFYLLCWKICIAGRLGRKPLRPCKMITVQCVRLSPKATAIFATLEFEA